MTSDPTVTRFAPSPTGYLQLGHYSDGGPLSVLLHASRDPGRDRARRGCAARAIRTALSGGHALTFEAQQRIGKQCSGRDYALRLNLAPALALTGPIEWVEEEEDGPHRKLADPAPLGDVVLARKDVPTTRPAAVFSKRDRSLTIRSLRQSGVSPAEIIARAALTGRFGAENSR